MDEVMVLMALLRGDAQDLLRVTDGYGVRRSVHDLCVKAYRKYGLLERRRGEHVAREFVVDTEETRRQGVILKGGWATELWRDECVNTLERHEDKLLSLVHNRVDSRKVEWCPGCLEMAASAVEEL
jgi:hypothetical protein